MSENLEKKNFVEYELFSLYLAAYQFVIEKV